MIISLAGHQGSGKSTVGKMLAERLGYAHHSTGDLFRLIARERGMTVTELNQSIERDGGKIDHLVDEYQQRLGKHEDDFVIDGRLAFHFIPQSFKIFFSVEPEIGAARIFHDDAENRRGIDHYGTLEEAVAATYARRESESKRYLEYYGIDHLAPAHFDFVIDTSRMLPETVFERVLEAVETSRGRA